MLGKEPFCQDIWQMDAGFQSWKDKSKRTCVCKNWPTLLSHFDGFMFALNLPSYTLGQQVANTFGLQFTISYEFCNVQRQLYFLMNTTLMIFSLKKLLL